MNMEFILWKLLKTIKNCFGNGSQYIYDKNGNLMWWVDEQFKKINKYDQKQILDLIELKRKLKDKRFALSNERKRQK